MILDFPSALLVSGRVSFGRKKPENFPRQGVAELHLCNVTWSAGIFWAPKMQVWSAPNTRVFTRTPFSTKKIKHIFKVWQCFTRSYQFRNCSLQKRMSISLKKQSIWRRKPAAPCMIYVLVRFFLKEIGFPTTWPPQKKHQQISRESSWSWAWICKTILGGEVANSEFRESLMVKLPL